jgi:selenocysteine-specific elongation factor
MFVVGTAGHIDHGKSSLVLRMTGIDPDRLPEEKERGMTIDLGFAWASLPSGRQIGIVDVPGHERFVKNMVAGVGGIDAVIFVIAADDGWMPQSEEHFQIISLLGIKTGLVALTKADLVDKATLELRKTAITNRLRGTFLDNCPIIPASTVTGDGYNDILKSLDSLLTDTLKRPDLGAARLFIDRRFTIQGMGTVVTGTLLEGTFDLDQQVEVQPSGLKTRIRSLQTHKQKITSASPGSRVAINLAGIEKTSIDRGEAICRLDSIVPSQRLAGQIELLGGAKFALKNGFELSFLLGTADVLGRVYLLDSESLQPGNKGFARIKLNSPVPAKLGDRFILRRISPPETIGGGVILDTEYSGDNKTKQLQKQILTRRLELSPAVVILTELDKAIRVPKSKFYHNTPFIRENIDNAIAELNSNNEIVVSGEYILSRKFLEQFIEPAIALLESDHKLRPWADGLEPGLLAKKLRLTPEQLPVVIEYLELSKRISREKGLLKLTNHQAQLKHEQLRLQGRLNARLSASPLSSPTRKEFVDEDPQYEVVINFMRDKGDLLELKGGILLTKRDFEQICNSLVSYLKQVKQATASDIKTYLKTSRKYVIPLLERLDQIGITRRDGDFRTLPK